ncbi:MAG: hypothetical protein AAGF23_05455 [Acidobacteriota bacterium]
MSVAVSAVPLSTRPGGDAGNDPHHLHSAHGLLFSSARRLPTWRAETGPDDPSGGGFDIRLHFGKPSGRSESAGPPSWRHVVSSAHLDAAGRPLVRVDESSNGGSWRRFSYHDAAVFHVDGEGRHVWLDWPTSMSLSSVWPYFTGPVLTWLLRLNGRVVLHAASVAVDGGAVLIAGPSGAGKSTTAAAFAVNGYRVAGDDTASLAPSGPARAVSLWPEGPHLRLWPEASPAVSGLDVESLPPICEGWEKRSYEVRRFSSEPLPLRAIFCVRLDFAAEDRPSLRRLAKAEALPTLVAQAAAPELSTREMRRTEFDVLADVAAQTPVFELWRPAAGGAHGADRVKRAILRSLGA